MSKQKDITKQDKRDIRQGLKEISEGTVVSLSQLEQKDRPDREDSVEKCMPTIERFEEVEKQVFFPIPKPIEFSATIRIYASTMSREAVRKTIGLFPDIEEAKREERERIIKDIRSILVKSDDLTIFLSRMEYYFNYLEALKGGGILLASAKVNKNIPINIPSNEVESDIELGVNDD